MNASPTPGPDARLARKQGRARMYAATLGVGAASVLGTVAIAAALPGSTAASTLTSASSATTNGTTTNGTTTTSDTSAGSTNDSSTNDSSTTDGSSSAGSSSQLQSGTTPSTTVNPPAATSGAS